MTCTGPNCTRTVHGRGLCKSHYNQRREGRPLAPLMVRPTPDGPCTADGCDTAAVSKGMCRLHYQAAWRAARGQAVRPKRPTKPRPKAKRKPKPKPASTLPNGWFKPSLKPVPPKPEAGAIDTVSLIAPVLDDATLAAARANVIAAGGTDLLAMLGLDEVAA